MHVLLQYGGCAPRANSIRGSGHLNGRSCDDILLYAVDSITQELDEKHIVCCAFLDLRIIKAFDSLDHV